MKANTFKGLAIYAAVVTLVLANLSAFYKRRTLDFLSRPDLAARLQYPHGHPPDDKTGRQPKPTDSQGGSGWVVPLAVGAGAGAVALGLWLHSRENAEKTLDEKGPQLEEHFNMSGFTVKGFCKGGWPVVLDFQIDNPGAVVLSVHNSKASRDYRFDSGGNRRIEGKLRLAADFGGELSAGVYSVRSESSGPGRPAYLRMYAMAGGERGVGSAAIDLLRFGPETVPRNGEAQFGFHSHSEFDFGRAEFFRSGLANGQIVNNLDDKQTVKQTIAEGAEIAQTWKTKKAKPGEHLLQVRAWRSRSNGGDFVVAWSPDLVDIQ